MSIQKKVQFILKISVWTLCFQSIQAHSVKVYTCPITSNSLREQTLSISKEDLNKEITGDIRIEFSNRFKLQKALKDSTEFEYFKSAITEIRKKIFTQLDNTNTSDFLKNKLKHQLINEKGINIGHSPKTFSFGKLHLENKKEYELYSISGEFQINSAIEGNKIFANYIEPEFQKLKYFSPPEKDQFPELKKVIEENKKKIDSLNKKIETLNNAIPKSPNKKENLETQIKNAKEEINKINKDIEDKENEIKKGEKYDGENKYITDEIIKTHSSEVKDYNNKVRKSDAEALILEEVLKLTSPSKNTENNNNFYSLLYDKFHETWNLGKKFPIDIQNIKKFKSLKTSDLNQYASGTLKLYTSYETCPSCKNAYILFSALRPNIKIEITTVSNELRNYLYETDFSKKN
ncbi:hypothetical protein GCL60_05060 [Silvanigrella paludirubra]|uniref:Uncharacterized protein n=1 Tax=Silvanigrella paludirubra TaxID=2499159 RepID=A0A6N6VU91_9BACT|nr:hypothetical protein [Silvanigrella paludirubra]KAB8039631.1 hypothetical protein GCL60_05060 [Silvanigrella paludirubra]